MLDPLDPFPSTPLTEREIMAVASTMVLRHDCDQFIAERVTLLALLEDAGGISTWRAVAARVHAIRAAPIV